MYYSFAQPFLFGLSWLLVKQRQQLRREPERHRKTTTIDFVSPSWSPNRLTLSSLGRFWVLARDRWTLSKSSKNDALGKVSSSSIQLPTHLRRSVGWIRGTQAYDKTIHCGSSDHSDIWEASGPSWMKTPINLCQALCELSRPETLLSNAMQRQGNAGNWGITGDLRSVIKHHRLLGHSGISKKVSQSNCFTIV